MSTESARHLTEEMVNNGPSIDGITALFVNRAHDALGYLKWDEYVHAELADPLRKLTDSERGEIAIGMREGGCSLRGISAVTGWSHSKVKYRVDGGAETGTTLGSDGVAYRAPSRRSFAQQVVMTAWASRNALEELAQLMADERFPDARSQVGSKVQHQLQFVNDESNRLLSHTS
jgi:hypothetical protein